MRTNIVLNDDLVREAMRLSKATSKRALVEEALRVFIEVMEARRRRETYDERLRLLRAKVADLRLREAPSSVLRSDRRR